MNGGVFIFMALAAIVVGLVAFSYTKPGKKIFQPEYNDE
jgi:Na+/H+-dicarboxylate symporter